MKYQLRDYQQAAVDAAISFLRGKKNGNGILVLPTGSGKSLIVAEIAHQIGEKVLVFCPNREIVQQNYEKMLTYTPDCSIFSASCGQKIISSITFATNGTVKNYAKSFDGFRYILVDEAHVTNPQGGMYKDFFERTDRRIIGLTATPYRLVSQRIGLDKTGKYDPNAEPKPHCIIKFLTRTKPKIFSKVLYNINTSYLLSKGFLSPLRYFDMSVVDQRLLKRNTTGGDFDDDSVKDLFGQVSFKQYLVSIIKRLQNPKSGVPRRGILVFTKFIEESEYLCSVIDGCAMVTGTTPKKKREDILRRFKSGKIEVLCNVGCLTTGFDYPELDTIVIGRPIMSLALYTQIVGRAFRPHKDKKEGWIVDLCGNFAKFGRVEDMTIEEIEPYKPAVCGIVGGKKMQLTNVYY